MIYDFSVDVFNKHVSYCPVYDALGVRRVHSLSEGDMVTAQLDRLGTTGPEPFARVAKLRKTLGL